MIYVFAFGDAYVKMGYHRSCPYRRRAEGFWHNVHPQALCGALDKCEAASAVSALFELGNAVNADGTIELRYMHAVGFGT